MFSAISLECGTSSIVIGRNTDPNTPDTITLLKNTFTEDSVEFNANDILEVKPFLPVNGSFTLKIQTPTSSGTAFYARKIDSILKRAAFEYQNNTGIPVKISFGTADSVVLTNALTSIKDVISNEYLETLVMDVNYTRLPIVGEDDTYPNLATTNTRFGSSFTPYILTETSDTFIPVPLSLQVKLYNQAPLVPSGLLLIANQPIIVLSGFNFYQSLPANNPPSLSLVTEPFFYPYSQGNGILRYVPTTTTPVVTSGLIYGNGRTSFISTPFARECDVYITYRTTVSGTRMNVAANAFSIVNGSLYSTPYTELQHTTNPAIAYLGTLYPTDFMYANKITLSMYPVGLISGALLIDRVVLHPKDTYASRSIQVSKLGISSLDTVSFPDSPTTSGNTILSLYSNYNPSTDFSFLTGRPTFTAVRTTGTNQDIVAKKVPTYQGNISLFVKQSSANLGGATPLVKLSTYFLSVGSVYDTVSGQSNWNLTDRNNNVTTVAWSATNQSNAKTLVLGYF